MNKIIILSLLAFLVLSQSIRAEILTDKEIYKPGEIMNVKLSYQEPLTGVEMSVINPDGNVEASKLKMKNISSNLWEYNYTLKTASLNGTYIISISAYQGGDIVNPETAKINFNKIFDVVPWRVTAVLNKYSFTRNDMINLNVLITDKYSDKLSFSVNYTIEDPSGNLIKNESFKLTEVNKGFTDTYLIPENYTFGTSVIKIILIDSDKRNLSINLKYSVSSILSITPSVINETTNEPIDKTINLENFGDSDINVNEIKVSENLENVISVIQRPYIIPQNGRSTLKLRIDATDLSEGTYSGTIGVFSDKGVNTIYVNLEVPHTNVSNYEDYSFIIWSFAIFIVVVIVAMTVLRYKKIRKKKAEEKKKVEEQKKKEDVYYNSQEEYRTEYY